MKPSSSFAEKLIFAAIYSIIYLLKLTYRWDFVDSHFREEAKKAHPKGSYIFASWHEFVIPAVLSETSHRHLALASRSFAGRLSGFVLDRFGYDVVYGSQKRGDRERGGKEARENLLEGLALGRSVALLPDASTGPRRIPKPGAVYLAKKSGAAILPFHCQCDRFWRLNTWDKLLIPKPFAKITCIYSKPIIVASNENIDLREEGSELFESYQEKLQEALLLPV